MKGSTVSAQISGVCKLKMVNFYHFFGEDGPMYGLLAYYQDKVINLCNADDKFQELFDRIVYIYERESKTNVIQADEHTKDILRKAEDLERNAFMCNMASHRELDTPLVLPKAFSYVYLLPMAKYVLKTIYGDERDAIQFDDHSGQWFGKGILEAIYHGKRLCFPYQINTLDQNRHEMMIRDVLSMGNLLKMEFFHGYRGITVSYFDTFYCHEGYLYFQMSEDSATISHHLMDKDKTLIQSEIPCVGTNALKPSPKILEMTRMDSQDFISYELPWGDLAFCAKSKDGEQRIYASSNQDVTISLVLCRKHLLEEQRDTLDFGLYAFRLYERNDVTEMHLLDMEYPRLGIWNERYAGKWYEA